MVNVGTDRAEVFVDGAKVGSSPYLGTISGRKGAKLDSEVVITKGVVYGYERTCEAALAFASRLDPALPATGSWRRLDFKRRLGARAWGMLRPLSELASKAVLHARL